MSKKIAVIGECMIELSEKGSQVNRGFGGDTLNTSVYIARQVSPAELSVNYVTALGHRYLQPANDGRMAGGERQHRPDSTYE
ncbi:Uncharacterised protein [Kluyvera cryocrescens]|uniref:2-dehydro-3-deoxygluconokinase n=1 Tax=Kluyvera cryocrescens TaxID=580 RepID=A0A485AJY6_KLUCR|nr:Uncharacterised protein [Kluyvera cryocrescens]